MSNANDTVLRLVTKQLHKDAEYCIDSFVKLTDAALAIQEILDNGTEEQKSKLVAVILADKSNILQRAYAS